MTKESQHIKYLQQSKSENMTVVLSTELSIS